ncbi:protein of unknown function [Poseidonocella pacifica]|uniref:YjiS-like domain-containing protein n=1 Tax=Poseidonocella pacifica TaxID=871651 RepID=A0A1I0VKD2_9RHOB|nr:DUF1127 domain-containing protein [Poseidonocella pacifica]SFA76487.1 protein of unknown function [Poseidonocella pacifica]
MAQLFTTLRAAMNRRVNYHRTLSALRDMPQRTATDLGINPDEARRTAAQAIYG